MTDAQYIATVLKHDLFWAGLFDGLIAGVALSALVVLAFHEITHWREQQKKWLNSQNATK